MGICICAEADTCVLYVRNQNKSEIIAEWLMLWGRGRRPGAGVGVREAARVRGWLSASSCVCMPDCLPACMRVRVCVASWPLVDFAFNFSFSFRLACAYAASKEAAAAVVTVHVISINLPEIADQPASQLASQPVNLHNTIIVQRNL